MHTLDDTLVVTIEQAVAAPFATRQLADLGARVIKIERPDGGDFARGYDSSVHGEASYFVWLNRGKESLALDLKQSDDRAVLDAVLARADVFVQNLAPGAAERLGLGAAGLRERHPRLITCSISGYGSDGPYGGRKAYDLLIQCETGLVDATGSLEERAKVGISIADIATGMYAYSGILAALIDRGRTGEGSAFEVTMLDALGEWMQQPYYYSAYGNRPTVRSGARHLSIAPYGPFPTADGATVFLGLQNDREWAKLATIVMERPDLVDDPRFARNVDRVAQVSELEPIVASVTARHLADDLIALLDRAGIANARIRTPAELGDHPQLRARDRWRGVSTPGGPAQALLPPVTVAGRTAPMLPVPALDEHGPALRKEFGPAEVQKGTLR